MNAPRICLLAGSFYPIVGGGERHAHLLAREWACRGISVRVLTRRRTSTLACEEKLEGFTIHRVGPTGFPRLGKYLMLGPALGQLWKTRDRYDVIYVCGLRVLGIVGVLGGLWTGKPCVLRAEARGEMDGGFIWRSPEGKLYPIRRFFFRPLIVLRNSLLRRAPAFLSISTPIREEFLESGVAPERIADIPNGLDTDAFQPGPPEERAELRAHLQMTDQVIYAYSGKLNRGKGLELLLRAWKRFSADTPDARLLLIGSGDGQHLSCEDELRAYVDREKLGASVMFTGYTDRVTEYLNAADAFVFPSESEAQGLAVLEALACNLPVIASRIPGIMDMVTDGVNGRLVDARDEDAWVAALTEFKNDPEPFQAFAEQGRIDALATYGIAAVADKHLALFQSLSSAQ